MNIKHGDLRKWDEMSGRKQEYDPLDKHECNGEW